MGAKDDWAVAATVPVFALNSPGFVGAVDTIALMTPPGGVPDASILAAL